MLAVNDIIKRAGGASAIERLSAGRIKAQAVYKWPKIGIPDRHWPLLIRLADVDANVLLAANIRTRRAKKAASE